MPTIIVKTCCFAILLIGKSAVIRGMIMKKLLFAMIFITTVLAANAFDISQLSVKGQAKSVTKTNYLIVQKFGEYFRTPSAKVIYTLNGAGVITQSVEYNGRDELQNKIVSTRDSNGNLTNETCYDAENNQLWNTVIEYANGLKTSSTEYSKGGTLRGKTVYVYNGNRPTEETYYNGDGAIVWKEVTKYTINDQIDTEYTYYANGQLDECRVYSYTSGGLIDTIVYSDGNDAITKKDVFHYDDRGLLTEITTYDNMGKVTVRTIIKHDSHDNVNKITTYNVQKKFGTTVNDMVDMSEMVYEY